ncbi:MAG: TetR/AcrR family transcriptional regulator [Anaerolineales bacterium]|nr:TetR/AcrR family transcriptional regulator [Anaerolineales bacterium]
MPKAFTEHEKEIIHQRLLEEGFRLFSAYGLRKTNVEEIASAAGISKGAFYNFHESKEALFMDVVEEAEKRFRQEILADIDLPGETPRARLVTIFRKAFVLFKTFPLLQAFSRSEYDLLFRRLPEKKLQDHLGSDRRFFEELIARCRQSGIPIQAPIEQISGLMYAVFFASMHENDFGVSDFSESSDVLLELIAAFCLGEIKIQSHN